MADSLKFYRAYKKRGGQCTIEYFKELLRAFFEHTLNSHVFGEVADTSRKDDHGMWLHPSPDVAEASWAEQTSLTARDFACVFRAVDSVHAYT